MAEYRRSLWKDFCHNSTIHGTYFLSSLKPCYMRIGWAILLLAGWTYAIHNCFEQHAGWVSNPVVTSVQQIPIDKIPFPAITICPLQHSRYGKSHHVDYSIWLTF